jgi:C-terminal processing protease CtpA/Prc
MGDDRVRAVFGHLDPFSRYVTPEEAQLGRDRRLGQGGVGLRLAVQRGQVVVVAVTAGGPAAAGGIRVGDRLTLGDVLLELTAPRIPCGTLATRMGDPQFVKRFRHAERCGAYARVLRRGTVQSGLTVTLERAPSDFPAIVELFRYWYDRPHDQTALTHALQTPIGARLRATFAQWVNSSFA